MRHPSVCVDADADAIPKYLHVIFESVLLRLEMHAAFDSLFG